MTSIRPYAVGDERLLFEAAIESVQEVNPWLPWCHANYTLGEARDWIAVQEKNRRENREFHFAALDETGRYVGGCGINRIDPEHRFANLGYWVRSSATGRGVATEAARLTAAWAFEHTRLDRLELVVATQNRASARVAEKLGARLEGMLRSRLQIHGEPHDAYLYSIVQPRA